VEIEHPHVGVEWLYGMPWLLSHTPGSVRTPAPLLGQHNEYVFHELLGMSTEEIERLKERQVIY
jgi:crotonobetainyl-CoA:carnitine CoA-transferase CaiB-like acyl-CoA transferase